MNKHFRNARRFVSSTVGKVGTGATALMASGAAFAAGSSPGAAIAGELSGGKADMALVFGAVAILLGALLVWGYIKRAR